MTDISPATANPATPEDTVLALKEVFGEITPFSVVIAGSGLGGFAKSAVAVKSVGYSEIPGVGESTVEGHDGKLLLVQPEGFAHPFFIAAGRRHLYEGIEAGKSAWLLKTVLTAYPSVKNVVISNAAGGLNPLFEVGDLMLISDQINWMFRNPLIGKNVPSDAPRFPDMSEPYSKALRDLARSVAAEMGLSLQEGVYIGGLGPSYETRAEVNMLRNVLGGDTVGMSTVLETVTAVHLSRRVLGISFVSNLLTVPAVTTHEEVMENSRFVEQRFSELVTEILRRLDSGLV